MKRFFLFVVPFLSLHLSSAQSKIDSIDIIPNQNVIAWCFTDLATANVSISYECLNKLGKLGVKIPIAFGLDRRHRTGYDEFEVFGGRSRVVATGIGLNYYPKGAGRKYFIGASYGFALEKYGYLWDGDTSVSLAGASPGHPKFGIGHSERHSFHINNGWVADIGEQFNITGTVGIGALTEVFEGYNLGWFPSASVQLALGYRFH